MPAPTATDAQTYLSASSSDQGWDLAEITSAFNAEKAAQAAVCKVPTDAEVWPADLTEALFRRIAHNLALRALPLGVQANISEVAVATTRVGGTDAEVRRLEAPHRRLVVG